MRLKCIKKKSDISAGKKVRETEILPASLRKFEKDEQIKVAVDNAKTFRNTRVPNF